MLRLELEDLELKTEFSGSSSSEQTKIELTFKELSGTKHTQHAPSLYSVYPITSHVTTKYYCIYCNICSEKRMLNIVIILTCAVF